MATATPGPTAEPTGDGSTTRSLGELFAQAQQDAMLLVRQEIELAKAEMRSDARRAGTSAGMFVVAVTLLALASVMLSAAAALGLAAAGLHPAVGFVIVGGVYVLVAAILAAVGARQISKIKGPERAKEEVEESKALLDHLRP